MEAARRRSTPLMMIKKNVLSEAKTPVTAHHGQGKIDFVRLFATADFVTDLSFIDYVVVPPGSSIGIHEHGDNEEVYFIVSGSAMMTTNGQRCRVAAGDLIVNKPGWRHGLENDSASAVTVLVWEVACHEPAFSPQKGR